MKKLNLSILCLSVFFLASCGKDENFSPLPEITFDRFVYYQDNNGKDTLVDFIFSLVDGDGDIGFRENEYNLSCGADNFNLYIAYEEKNGSVYRPKKLWLQVTEVTTACDTLVYFDSVQVKFNQRMQYIEPAGNSKGIEATVTYRMDKSSAIVLLSQVGRFDFYIRDRAGNKSNRIYTEDILINK